METKSHGFHEPNIYLGLYSAQLCKGKKYKLPCGVVYASEDSGHVGNLDYRFHTHICPIPSESSETVRQLPHLDLHMKSK